MQNFLFRDPYKDKVTFAVKQQTAEPQNNEPQNFEGLIRCALSFYKKDRIHSFDTCPPLEDSTFMIRYSIFFYYVFLTSALDIRYSIFYPRKRPLQNPSLIFDLYPICIICFTTAIPMVATPICKGSCKRRSDTLFSASRLKPSGIPGAAINVCGEIS